MCFLWTLTSSWAKICMYCCAAHTEIADIVIFCDELRNKIVKSSSGSTLWRHWSQPESENDSSFCKSRDVYYFCALNLPIDLETDLKTAFLTWLGNWHMFWLLCAFRFSRCTLLTALLQVLRRLLLHTTLRHMPNNVPSRISSRLHHCQTTIYQKLHRNRLLHDLQMSVYRRLQERFRQTELSAPARLGQTEPAVPTGQQHLVSNLSHHRKDSIL